MIQTENVRKVYTRGTTETIAVQNASVVIPEKSAVAIVGPSGCGKSTFLMMLGGIVKPSQGKIVIKGKEIWALKEKKRAELRKSVIAYVMQNSFLLEGETVERNLEIPLLISGRAKKRKERRKAIKDILEQVGLGDKMHEIAGNLSGGEQQRVAVARALLQNAEIILADEPTGALDTEMGEQIFLLLL